MKAEALSPAVQEGGIYLERFTRKKYAAAFREYTERFGPLYVEAVRECGLAQVAEALLDVLEEGWMRQRIWNRSAVRASEKQMMVAYLSPMLLSLEEPEGSALAETLRDAWAARWPKDAYEIAPYEKLKKGFRNVILGIEFGRRDDDEEES